jgi:hypothetical protein
VKYGQKVPPILPDSEVFIVDFSYPAPVLAEMGKVHHQVTVLDHHATAEKDLSFENFQALGLAHPTVRVECGDFIMPCANLRIRFDMNKSGAVMAWEYFQPNVPVPLFFLLLQDRDLWTFHLPFSRELSAYLQTQPYDFECWEHLMNGHADPAKLHHYVLSGTACLQLKKQMIETMAREARIMFFDMSTIPPRILPQQGNETFLGGQHIVPVANTTVFFSEVGERLLEQYPRAAFSAYYFDRADGKRQWGLRSRPDFDCSAIAKAFGGGGHKQSSGFTEDIPWPERTMGWADPQKNS